MVSKLKIRLWEDERLGTFQGPKKSWAGVKCTSYKHGQANYKRMKNTTNITILMWPFVPVIPWQQH